MGSHPTSPVKVTDLLLNMVAKASQQDQAFLIDLAALQVTLTVHLSCCHCIDQSGPVPALGNKLLSRDFCLLQEKHVETAKLLLGEGKELNQFVSRLLDDIANLKAMLHAISIGAALMHLTEHFLNCFASILLM